MRTGRKAAWIYAFLMAPRPLPDGALTHELATAAAQQIFLEALVIDFVLFFLGLGLFALLAGYALACERV